MLHARATVSRLPRPASAASSSARRVSGGSASIRRRYAHSAEGGSDPSRGALRATLLRREAARDLHERERVALPAVDDPVDYRSRQLVAEPSRKHRSRVLRVERPEPHLLGVREAVGIGFGRDQQRDPVDPQAVCDERDRLGRRLVQQVRVVDDDEQRSRLLRRRREEVEHAGVDREAIHRARRCAQPERGRERRRPRGGHSRELAEQRLAQFRNRREVLLALAISATRAQHRETAGPRQGVVEQRRLSRSRLAADDDHRAAALTRRGQRALDPGALAITPDQLARGLDRSRLRSSQCACRAGAVAQRQRVLQPASEELSRGLAQARYERPVVIEEGRQRSGAVPRLEHAHGLRKQPQPSLEVLARSLEVALDAVGDAAEPDRLVLVPRRPRQPDRARWQLEVVGVPLAHFEVGREATEHRVVTGRRGQEHLVDPELGLQTPVVMRTEGGSEKLRAEAHAEVRDAGEHRLADGLLLGRDPGILVVVPHVHPRTHDHEEVVRDANPGSPHPRRA